MCVDYCAGLRWRAGRRSGPQPILHTLGAPCIVDTADGSCRSRRSTLKSRRQIMRRLLVSKGKDMGSGSAWRRSLKEGRLDPIATKSGKSQRNHAISALPFLRPVRKSIES